MKPQSKVLLYSIILAVLFYVVDSVLDVVLFYKDLDFFQVFITNPPINELYTRLLGMAVIIILGIILPRMLIFDSGFGKSSQTQNHKISSDPALMVNVSNLIKTPLNAILGFVDLLNDPNISDISKDLYLGHVGTSGKYLMELINNITDITMIEAGQLYIKKTECRLNVMLSDLYKLYDKLIKEKKEKNITILLKTSEMDNNFIINTDEKRLKQILVNLLENAFNFTDKGVIEFGYNLTGKNSLEFYVKDTGKGISMERLEMIFKQFTKVIDIRMRPFDLASLRIIISKHLVQLMGGELQADSQLGHGSDFRFRLVSKINYIDKDDASEMVETADTGVNGTDEQNWTGKHILIAEDVESNFIYLQEILMPTGVKISWAKNGREAVKLCLKNKNFDVVLMDILMPEMDGYEAAKAISEALPEMPIIAQTACHLDEADYKDAMNYFRKYLTKPIWSYDLLNGLKEYMS